MAELKLLEGEEVEGGNRSGREPRKGLGALVVGIVWYGDIAEEA